jgi:long-chain acyl-CoA synthetase
VALDVELYRRTLYAPATSRKEKAPRISVIDIAPEDATETLVFVHGYGGRSTQWIYQLRAFGQQARVIAPDLRGHGLSDDPRDVKHSIGGLVDDLEWVLRELGVQTPFSLIAHSFGGAVATEYALRHPEEVRRLVLIAVPARFILRPGTRALMSLPAGMLDGVARSLNLRLYAPIRTLRRMHDGSMAPWRGTERLKQLRVPTLVILGQRDTVFAQQHYAAVPKVVPGASQVVIPVSAHLVQLERPDATNRAIRRFLEANRPGDRDRNASDPRHVTGLNGANGANGSYPNGKRSGAQRLARMPWLQHYDNEVPHDLPVPRLALPEILGNAAREFPGRTALFFFGQHISYRELDLLSNRFAQGLRSLGVQRGDRVAILLPNVPQCVIAFYGVLKVGAVAVMGSQLTSEQDVAFQMRDAQAKVALTLEDYRDLMLRAAPGTTLEHLIFTGVREYLPLDARVRLVTHIPQPAPTGHEPPATAEATSADSAPATERPPAREWAFQRLLRESPSEPLLAGPAPEDLALLQYTSGTTDMPKGVMLSHGNLVANVLQNRHWMPDARRGEEIVLGVLPLAHSYGITACMNLSIALASALVLLPTTRTKEILKAIKRYSPTLFPGVPAIYSAVAHFPRVRRYGVASIRICVSGSAPLPVEVQEEFEKLTKGRLVEGYGLTEASPATHSNPLQGERRVGSIGVPLPGTEARVVDSESGEPVAPGEVGELLIRGPQVMQGYWQRPVETEQALAGGWLHTGDLAHMDDDGFFTIVDRKKDLILAGPYAVYPRDVEEVLYEHPKVMEAVVVGARSGDGNPVVKAIVVLKRGERATAEELLALCRERLEAYKVPQVIEFRRELPKTVVGKVLRRLLVDG